MRNQAGTTLHHIRQLAARQHAAEAPDRQLLERFTARREEAAFEALVTRMEHADPAWLDEKVSYGDSLERVIQDDGPEHYREHALDLRAWFTGADEEADASDATDPEGAD